MLQPTAEPATSGKEIMDYKRRAILTAAGAATAMGATSRQLFAGWEPSERYPDPAVQALFPRFAKYRLLLAGVERLAVGMRWSEGRRGSATARPGVTGFSESC